MGGFLEPMSTEGGTEVRVELIEAADPTEDQRARVGEAACATVSRPRTGKGAVKVINHYGDEVMKVLME